MRKAAREVAFKVIFASRFTGEYDKVLEDTLIKKENLNDDDKNYLGRIFEILSVNESGLSELIDKYSRDFPESRLFPADKSALLLALAEIKFMDDIPSAVSVNEAANIVSVYSTPKSADFISGILSEIIKE